MADRVHRITMFKLPSKDDQAKLLDQYNKLSASQQKVTPLQSTPYWHIILTVLCVPGWQALHPLYGCRCC